MAEKKPTLDDFTALLKQTVEAKRLSGGKVQEVVQLGVKFLRDDVALLHTMYKTHKDLPKRSQNKISSLYVLDSLARGVHKLYKSTKEKDGKTAGFAKGFLLKVEGILDGWARDMCEDWPEGREKMIKILDIWVKSQTFSATSLERVQTIINHAATNAAAADTAPESGLKPKPESTTPIGSPIQAKQDVKSEAVNVVANTTGTATPPVMPDFLSFLSSQIQSVAPINPPTPMENALQLPSKSVPPSLPHLPSFNGVAHPMTPPAHDQPPNPAPSTPSNVIVAPQSSYPQHSRTYPVPDNVLSKPAQPALPSPKSSMDSAMAKRDAIAKRLSMMGPGGSSIGSLLPVPYAPVPMQSRQVSAPSVTPISGSSTQQPSYGMTASSMQAGYLQADKGMSHRNAQRGPSAALEPSSSGTSHGPISNRFGPSYNAAEASNGEPVRSGGSWNPNSHRPVRSRSPPTRYPDRQASFDSDRTPLVGVSGQDEFGRDRGNHRSASPHRTGADSREWKRPRIGETGNNQADGGNESGKDKRQGLEDLDVTMLNPADAKTWEILGEAWTVSHGRPPEGPDVMMWFMTVTAQKLGAMNGMNENPMMAAMTSNHTPMNAVSPMDNSHQQARLDWNDDGPYSSGGGQRGGGAGGGRDNW